MKASKKNGKQLRLDKIRIMNFEMVLEREGQKVVKGGTIGVEPTTDVPAYCKG